jgi:4-carboxymuconolactone decarboxylase
MADHEPAGDTGDRPAGDTGDRPAGDTGDRYATGMATRRAVLGDAHVDRASAAATAFDADFQRFITESAWGAIWSREGLSRRDRSLLTIALLAALGHEGELAMHIRASANTGATADEIRETLMQVAVYAGVPAANTAIRVAKETLAAMAAEAAGS